LRAKRAVSAAQPLAAILTTEKSPLLRRNIIGALGEIKAKEVLPVLIQLLKDPDAFTRYDAANALGELGDARAIPALTEIISDRSMPEQKDDGGAISTTESVGAHARRAIQKIDGQTKP
jgi:HEAT repeat protein